MKKHLLILVSLILVSCGARKVQVNTSEIKKDSVVNTTEINTNNSSITTDENSKIVDNSTNEEITIVPVDSTKEFKVNGKTYFNVKLSIKKTKANSIYKNNKKVSEIDLKQQIKHTQAKTSTKQNTKVKNVDRKASYSYLWILIILIIIYTVYKWQNKLRLL